MYTTLLILHFIGLSLGAATPLFMKALASHAETLATPEEKFKLMIGAGKKISRIGSIGLLLLIISGLPMLVMRGDMGQYSWHFHAKMTLVLILILYVGFMQMLMAKARKNQDQEALKKMQKIGILGPIITFATLIFAVLTFH